MRIPWPRCAYFRLMEGGCFLIVAASMIFAPPTLAANQKPLPVTVTTLKGVEVFPSRSAPAAVVSLNDTQVSAQVTGIIEKLPVKPGDLVEANTLLVELDCHDHELEAREPAAQLEEAKAEKALADFQYQRAAKLRKKGAISTVDLQRRKTAALKTAAEVQRLRALVEESERAVSKCEIRAPFRAVVVKRLASVGELASPGMKLMRVVDEDHLEVSSQIQEQDLGSLRQEAKAKFMSRNQRYPVKLRSVIPVLDQRMHSYEVRFVFTAANPSPGQTGRIVWQSAKPHIPADLLVSRDGRLGVFLASKHRASFEPLKDAHAGQPVATELPGSTRLIVDGRYSLRNGQPITVVAPH